MKNVLAAIIVGYIVGAVIFPERVGKAAHELFNRWKSGWEQVQ